jgi:uncharacterized protein YgiM (DUF1202 family)
VNGMRILRAVSALTVLLVILLVVSGWWQDYREAVPGGRGVVSEPTTASAEPASDTDDEDSDDGDSKDDKDKADANADGPEVEVLIEGLNFRESPSPDGKRIRGLKKGDKLTLIKTESGWHQVRASNGDEGWVSGNPQYTKIEGR